MAKELFDLSYYGNYISFADVNDGAHIIPIKNIRLGSILVKRAITEDEEDEIYFYIKDGENEIPIDAATWTDIETFLMKEK